MDIVLEQYRTRLQQVKQVQPATLIAYDKAAQKFQRHLDAVGKRANEMQPWDIEEYLAALEFAPTTKRTHWIHLRGALRYAHRRGMFRADPTTDVYLAPPPKTEPQTIPTAELRKMKDRIQIDRQWLAFHLLVYTGMRQGEIRGLRWADVDFLAGLFILRRTKGGRLRYVPIHPILGEVLAELRGDDGDFVVTARGTIPLSYTTWIEDLLVYAPGYTAHWFRRTWTSTMLDNGVDIYLVKQIMGHEEQSVMGKFYAKPNQRVMQTAILKAYADDPV